MEWVQEYAPRYHLHHPPPPRRDKCRGATLPTMIKTFLLALALAVSLTGAAVADPFEDGLAAYNKGDYEGVFRLWLPLADSGWAPAQFGLGFLYANGQGVAQDYAEAANWYRKAADRGDAHAQANLAILYANGQGVAQDYAEAAGWYRKAADQGDAHAQLSLGLLYASGQGVPQDHAQAASWYRKAANRGDAHAQILLGDMYENGQGVPQDYVQSHMLWNLAASRSADPVQRADAARRRDLVAAKMSTAQIADAQRLASAWKAQK